MSTQDEGATMTAWTSRLQPSSNLGVVAGPSATRRAVVPKRALVAIALACLALGVVLHQGLLSSGSRTVASGVGSHAISRAGLLSLPVAAQGPVSAALGRDDAAYRINGLAVRNPAQRFSARFGRSGVTIMAGVGKFNIGLKAFGRGATLRTLQPVSPVASTNGASYAYGSLREWWANGPVGLEQGFDIASRPAGSGALALSLAVPGGVRLVHGTLLLPGGLRYAGVRATDAGGRVLPAWLTLRGGRAVLHVNDRGARYPLRVNPYVQQSAELTASDAAEEDVLGYSVAVSGNTAVVGAPHQSFPQPHEPSGDTDPGAVYVFEMGAGGWAQTAKLTAPDGPADGLGWSVAISETGETIVAGAPGPPSVSNPCASTEGNLDPGQVFVYTMPNGGWKNMIPTAELEASDACVGAGFGWSVGISGSTIVAGAPWGPTTGAPNADHPQVPGQGEAYEYTMPAGGWKTKTQTAELTASNPSGEDVHNGWSVAVSGETIVTGDPTQAGDLGAAYVFVKPNAGEWTNANQTAELSASAPDPVEEELGTSVAVSGNTIVAGAPLHTVGAALGAGVAYVYVKPQAGKWTNGTQTAELTASDTDGGGDDLGYSVAVSGNTVVAGAPSYQVCEYDDNGAAYAFTMPAGGWTNETQTGEMTSSDGYTSDSLGHSVAISANTIVAGAPRHLASAGEPNREAGAAYVFNNGESPALECGGATGGTKPITTGSSATTGSSSATTGSQTTTGSATATTVSPALPSAQVGSISAGSGKFTVTLSCPAGGPACATVSLQATVKESLKGGKLTAVTAGAKKKKTARATTKQVVVASGSVTLPAGATQTLALKLNSTGQALLAKFGKLTAIVTVSSAGRTIDTTTVTVLKTKPKKKKKKK